MKTKLILLSLLGALGAHAQGTALTYQGRLQDAAGPAHGTYDFQFTVRDALTGGSPVGVNPLAATLAVSNGLFTVTLDPGAGVFDGADRWLEIAVRTNGGVSFTALSPRQQITAAPYAITAGNLNGALPSANLSGTYGNAVTLNNPANSFSGNGAGLTNLNASQLTTGTVPAAALSNAWKIGGNSGATPGANFLGTTDTNALEFKVNNQRALRLEPTANTDTVNVIGGSAGNSAGAGTVGATIGGGGSGDYFGAIYTNRVEGDFGTVSGGALNTIQSLATYATIGGGALNKIQSNAAFATIGGGTRNTIQTNATYATLGGGDLNVIRMNASYATLGGGTLNEIGLGAVLATIDGGSANVIGQDASYTTIGGGSQNTIQRGSGYTTIGGGLGNQIALSTAYATIAGGTANTIQTLANSSTIGGGNQNTNLANADYATIPGGLKNTAGNDYATVGGGANNTGSGQSATVGGGEGNVSSGQFATVPGGNRNSAVGDYSFAAGRRAKANHTGAFVWADGTAADFASSAVDQFLVRAKGGVGINKPNPATALDVFGTITATDFSGNGAGLTNVTALTVGGLSSSNLWKTTGNAGATPGAFFVGTTDTNALELKVNNQRGLRLEPTTNSDTVNVIGGSARNSAGAGTVGATIGGGGSGGFGPSGLASTNRVDADFGTVSGGGQNTIQPDAGFGTIGGGYLNTIRTNVAFGTIGGGYQNTIQTNEADSPFLPKTLAATIGGGRDNTIQPSAPYATIPGGRDNNAAAYAFAAGRRAKANHTGAFVWADSSDNDFVSTAENQFLIRAAGGVGINTNNPHGAALAVNGNITVNGVITGNGAGLTNLSVALGAINWGGVLSWPGTFVPASSPGVGGYSSYSVTTADVNGDGHVDLISANTSFNTLSVLTNHGNGTFTVASSPVVGIYPQSVTAADVNGDGHVDLISANYNPSSLSVLTNHGNGTFTLASSPSVGLFPQSVTAADVNGDGRVDLISASTLDAKLDVLANQGNGTFTTVSTPPVGSDSYSVTAADVNGDGHVDLINANAGLDSLWVLTNRGNGDFALASSLNVGDKPMSVTAADVNGDGQVDLVSANSLADTLSVLTNHGNGTFTLAASPTVGLFPQSVTAADVNGDGRVDLISASSSAGTLSVLTNHGHGAFTLAASPHVGGLPRSVTTADVNGDGRVDLISARSNADTLAVLTNAAVFNGIFSGNGVGLTDLNAGSLAGTVSDARLSTNVALRAGGNAFTGDQTIAGNVSVSGNQSFGTQTRQMLNLWGTNYGIGVLAATLYFRCDTSPGVPFAGFRWYKGGAHDDATGNAGGGTELMRLDSGGNLFTAGAINPPSDRNPKENLTPVSAREVLEKVAGLAISRWNFKADTATPHLGPMAQDFHAAFGLGTDDKHIATVDADGVALAAIQGLNEKVEVRSQKAEVRIQKLQMENAELKQRLEKLERLMSHANGGAK